MLPKTFIQSIMNLNVNQFSLYRNDKLKKCFYRFACSCFILKEIAKENKKVFVFSFIYLHLFTLLSISLSIVLFHKIIYYYLRHLFIDDIVKKISHLQKYKYYILIWIR